MLAARHRFPSRGAMAVRTAGRGRAEGPMVTAPPPQAPTGMFRGSPLPLQDLVGTAVRELRVSMLDAATAIRLGGDSARPRYFGTVLPSPTEWLAPAGVNGADQVRAGVVASGNAPQALNKTTAQGGGEVEAPRVARDLPRGRR